MDHHNDGYNQHNHHHRSWHLWLLVDDLNHDFTILVGWIANNKRKKKKDKNKNKHKKKGRHDIMRVLCMFVLLCSLMFSVFSTWFSALFQAVEHYRVFAGSSGYDSCWAVKVSKVPEGGPWLHVWLGGWSDCQRSTCDEWWFACTWVLGASLSSVEIWFTTAVDRLLFSMGGVPILPVQYSKMI